MRPSVMTNHAWRDNFVGISQGLSYFDNVRHHILLEKVARRVSDGEVLHLLGLTLKAYGWASLRAE